MLVDLRVRSFVWGQMLRYICQKLKKQQGTNGLVPFNGHTIELDPPFSVKPPLRPIWELPDLANLSKGHWPLRV